MSSKNKYTMSEERLLKALRKVDGLNSLKDISVSNFMMKIRIFLAVFYDMRLPCAKRLDHVVSTFRHGAKKNPAKFLEEASTSICKELEGLGLSVAGIRPAALLLEKYHKSFIASLKSLLRYRKARQGGGGESERTILLSSPTEEKHEKHLHMKEEDSCDNSMYKTFLGTKRKNHQRSRRRPKTTIAKTPKRVPNEWEDEIRTLRDEVEMLRGVTKEFMQENNTLSSKCDDVDDDMIRTILMQQRELRAQNAQLKRQLGLFRDAIETQDEVISEVDSAISEMYVVI